MTVPVVLTTGRKTARVFAKVDTGAEYCVFEREVAESLLVAVEHGEPANFSTANSTFRAWGHELTISVLGIETDALVFFYHDPEIKKTS